jgi:fatty-acyl-CoA synthase
MIFSIEVMGKRPFTTGLGQTLGAAVLQALGSRGRPEKGDKELAEGRALLIGDILRRAAETRPDAPAASMGDAVLSYAELERDANRLAQVLRNELGIGHGDRVVVWADTALEVLPLFVALAKLGAVYAPLNARLGANEASEVARLAQAQALVCDGKRAGAAREVARAARIATTAIFATVFDSNAEASDDTAIRRLDPRALPDPIEPIREPRLAESDPHVIFFTSGSTGRPKGVVLSHRANWLRGFQGVFRDEPERTVCIFPLFHMAAFTLAIAAWQTRGEIIFSESSAQAILDAVERRRANRLYGLPLIFTRLLEEDTSRWDLSSLRQLDTGTSATPIELLRAIRERFPGPSIRVYYGSTECGSATALADADILDKPGSVGQASISVDLRVAEDGEICIRSPFLMDGYFDDPEATAAALEDGWFRTGDLGALDDEGYLSIVGRKKEVLRTGGESVSPSEVEGVLRDAPGVAEVAIVGLPDPDWGEVLCAAVVSQDGASIRLADLQAHCEGRLAGFKKPRRLVLLDRLPRTAATAQVQRTLLVEQILASGLASKNDA